MIDQDLVFCDLKKGLLIYLAIKEIKKMSKSITEKTEALAAVKNDGWALEDASDELKADKEVVMVAVKNQVSALEFASDELKADKEVVTAGGEKII